MIGVAPKKLLMTPDTIPNINYLAKFAIKSTPGLVDVEVLTLAVPGHRGVISGSYSLISGKLPIPR